MMKNLRKHRERSPLLSLLLGTLTAGGVFVAISLFFSVVTYLLKDPTAYIPVLSLPAFLLSGVVSGLLLLSHKAGLLQPLLSVLAFLLILLLIGVLVHHGALSYQILLYDASYLVAFVLVYLVKSLGGTKRHRHRG